MGKRYLSCAVLLLLASFSLGQAPSPPFWTDRANGKDYAATGQSDDSDEKGSAI